MGPWVGSRTSPGAQVAGAGGGTATRRGWPGIGRRHGLRIRCFFGSVADCTFDKELSDCRFRRFHLCGVQRCDQFRQNSGAKDSRNPIRFHILGNSKCLDQLPLGVLDFCSLGICGFRIYLWTSWFPLCPGKLTKFNGLVLVLLLGMVLEPLVAVGGWLALGLRPAPLWHPKVAGGVLRGCGRPRAKCLAGSGVTPAWVVAIRPAHFEHPAKVWVC